MNCLALDLYIVQTAADTLNQLGSTSQELPGSDEGLLPLSYTELCIRGGTYLIYPLASFKAVIVDEGVKKVGYDCNDPIPADVEVRGVGSV